MPSRSATSRASAHLVRAPHRRETLAERRVVGERRERFEQRRIIEHRGPTASTMSSVSPGLAW